MTTKYPRLKMRKVVKKSTRGLAGWCQHWDQVSVWYKRKVRRLHLMKNEGTRRMKG